MKTEMKTWDYVLQFWREVAESWKEYRQVKRKRRHAR